MIGKLFAAATGAAINKEQSGSPVTGAAVGFVTMAVARRFLPARFAAIGATVAAGYLSKKLAERAERRAQTKEAIALTGDAGVADSFALLEENTQVEGDAPRARTNPARTSPQTAAAIKVPEVTG